MDGSLSSLVPWGAGARTAVGEIEGFPYVRAGNGASALVVLPGVGDAFLPGRYPAAAAWGLGAYFRRFLDEYSVYLLSRPRGLADEGTTIRELARRHADPFEAAIGPADVLGVSMGGFLGQELAKVRPDLVENLVVAVSGRKVRPAELPTVRRWERLARERRWSKIRAELVGHLFADARRFAYPPLVAAAGPFTLPKPADPDDPVISLSAIESYDGTDTLGDLGARTLVIGGEEDPFFPESILRETAEGIPDAELTVIEGARHGAFHERKATFDATVRRFLNG